MNRQEAITELENLAWVQGGANRDKATEAISMAIKALKEPQNDWISCSKKLPEDGTYIVYAPTYQGGSSRAKECHDGVMFSKYKNGKWSIEHGYYERPNCVKAWLPLPAPFLASRYER